MSEEMYDSSTLLESFELQLSEIEMLSSMYPDESEFKLTLPHALIDMETFISRKTEDIPCELDFVMNVEVQDVKPKLELSITFPLNYPTSKPLVTARASSLNRIQQAELNSAIREYLDAIPSGELCILSLVNWLPETAKPFFALQPSRERTTSSKKPDSIAKETWCRAWIYSHHIFSKFKRKDILDIAQFLDLSGFSLPGKPGFICIEGTKSKCTEFFQQLKNMSWKKLTLVREELVDEEEVDIKGFKKFEGFEEISFQVRRGPAKEYHMDMGQFLKFLEEHECAYAFQDLFGLEGHASGDKALN